MRKIVIGDVQGCLDELKGLLEKIDFVSSSDQLIFLGDLVNRGPKSLEVLEYLYSMDHCVVNTLGNHDLHLIALAMTDRPYREKDQSLWPILNSKNKTGLIEWLRHQPIMHEEPALESIMVHAGIHPSWDILQARSMAREIESLLQSNNASSVLSEMYSDDSWSSDLEGASRVNSIINSFTRMRFLDQYGVCNFTEKNAPKDNDDSLMPWFMNQEMKIKDMNIFFGHWSTLGDFRFENVFCLDAGCVWGGEMIAIDLNQPLEKIKFQSFISK
ncbi:MAG TPA: symmetrical bis(5'-nucleosyl)-tetraphosphatase [Gammaproteobacteria bacterium]|jgi:bis(5'-nucleosyl)-tetraphosphatase (symmetrical)|nr:diadenosine tetraphosphatase [Gammaproteobacteria bacterium]MBQ09728.1 diadenosine tetraphosphatase [Gammaproteobacteria bacterium]HJL79587.1 symmetrical bis(5'-nucleosyl)-tetraphosphatase [Gammaproteobacteria bacterium]HJN00430.1 symmetrical bis(5'-nucleosyl)-tetraphosphatase [Gammaproteobacteria bacterium]|tara:strand:- start:17519 stop:18334 length:816 start_codon:yes stop_codon:yes gene_type:complete